MDRRTTTLPVAPIPRKWCHRDHVVITPSCGSGIFRPKNNSSGARPAVKKASLQASVHASPRRAARRESNKLIEWFNCVDGRKQPLSPERIEVILNRFRRVLQSQAHHFHCLQKERLR